MIKEEIWLEICTEKEYQVKKWGYKLDDEINTPFHWATYISQYATKWMFEQVFPIRTRTTDSFRSCMVKVATLAISAIESIDRQRIKDGKTFYEEK